MQLTLITRLINDTGLRQLEDYTEGLYERRIDVRSNYATTQRTRLYDAREDHGPITCKRLWVFMTYEE
jgi:hypothetical protein